MALVDNAIYVNGQRTADPRSLEETYELLRDGTAWPGSACTVPASGDPVVAGEFDLHPLAVEDAITAHQRAKLERYGTTLFTVLRPARYLEDVEQVEFGELHVFTGQDFVVTIRHAEAPDLGQVRRPAGTGPGAAAARARGGALRDPGPGRRRVRTGRRGLENDIDEIEDQLFKGDPAVSRRIYELSREVIEFQRATHPLLGMLTSLEAASTSTRSTWNSNTTCATCTITRSASSSEPTPSGRCCRTR